MLPSQGCGTVTGAGVHERARGCVCVWARRATGDKKGNRCSRPDQTGRLAGMDRHGRGPEVEALAAKGATSRHDGTRHHAMCTRIPWAQVGLL